MLFYPEVPLSRTMTAHITVVLKAYYIQFDPVSMVRTNTRKIEYEIL